MADDKKTQLFRSAPIPKAVALLSIPTVASSLVTLIYSLADTFFVGLINDPVQTAAVTLASTVTLAFNAVNNLFGVGASSMMSRAMGRDDLPTLRRSSAFGFYGSLICGVLFSLLCAGMMQPLLGLLGADSVTGPATQRYLFWTVCVGAPPSILNVVMAYLLRSEGATFHASMGTMSGCLLNIILDPLFILPSGLGMGAEGAALATLISNCAAVLYFMGYLFFKRKSTYVCVSPKEFTLKKEIAGGVCAVGVPASIQNLLNVVSHMALNNLAAPFGAAALAAMGIASKVCMVPMYLSNGISQGVMPLVGYTYAAGMFRRMKKAVAFNAKLSLSLLSVIALVCVLFSKSIAGAFIDDPQTVAYGGLFIQGMALASPFHCLDFLAVHVFQAVGKGYLSLFMAILRKAILEIPAYSLLNFLWPLTGLAFGQPLAELVMAVAGTILLLRFLKTLPAEKERPAPAKV